MLKLRQNEGRKPATDTRETTPYVAQVGIQPNCILTIVKGNLADVVIVCTFGSHLHIVLKNNGLYGPRIGVMSLSTDDGEYIYPHSLIIVSSDDKV